MSKKPIYNSIGHIRIYYLMTLHKKKIKIILTEKWINLAVILKYLHTYKQRLLEIINQI